MDGRMFFSKFWGLFIKIVWVNSIRVAIPMIFLNIYAIPYKWRCRDSSFSAKLSHTLLSLYTLGISASICVVKDENESSINTNFVQFICLQLF